MKLPQCKIRSVKHLRIVAMWRYYVYELIDSRNGLVFYVGKGCDGRIDQHEKDAAQGVSSKNCNRIRKIWNDGGKVFKQKIASFFDEKDAYEFEEQRIKFYGKSKLCNVAPLKDEEKETTQDYFRSKHFFLGVARLIWHKHGLLVPYEDRPFSRAVINAALRRYDELMLAYQECAGGFEKLRDGLKHFNIELVLADGRENT